MIFKIGLDNKNTMVYTFDIDGTICSETDGNYNLAKPYMDRINIINQLYLNNTIYFYTARGMGRSDNNSNIAYDKMYDYTENQLKFWGVKYHKLFLGKPKSDFYIDDKNILISSFFNFNKGNQ
jgi:hypothetical protein